MTSPLIKQAVFVPLAAMLIPVLASFAVPEYSSISQHLSELEMLDHPAAAITRIAAIISGASIILFSAGLLRHASKQYVFTVLAAFVFGASMISNGIFVMGSPLHGLYGIGIFMVLTPAFFAAESLASVSPTVRLLSMLASVATLLYMWLMLSGFDPESYRGLTQRVALIPIFGWYSFASYALVRSYSASAAKPHKGAAVTVQG